MGYHMLIHAFTYSYIQYNIKFTEESFYDKRNTTKFCQPKEHVMIKGNCPTKRKVIKADLDSGLDSG